MAASDGYVGISFTVNGETVVRKLAQWYANITDASPAWEMVGEYMLEQFRTNYAMEGGWVGKGTEWAPLAASTVKDRIRRGWPGEHPILERSGQLKESITERGAAYNVFDVRPDGVTIGTADPIAPFHQFGTSRMPARQMVGLTWYSKQDVVNILNRWIFAQAEAAELAMNGGGA